jgi:hypothetical protein
MNNQASLFSVPTAEGVIPIGLCTLFYQLFKHQGRILLRLDSLEQNAPPGFAASAEDTEMRASRAERWNPVSCLPLP